MCLFPEPCKVQKWAAGIRDALGKDLLSAGASQKLAGRLSWAQIHLFHKSDRALLCQFRPALDTIRQDFESIANSIAVVVACVGGRCLLDA